MESPPSASRGGSMKHALDHHAEEVDENASGRVVSSCVARFIQNDFYCPTFKVDGLPSAFTLMNDGAFSIRLDNNTRMPVLAKIELDGQLYSNEYRILPHGTRTIKNVHDSSIATNSELTYNFPIVFDNLLQCEVGPKELELHSIHEADEFTLLCRILFFPVRGGLAATRIGCWEVDRDAGVLAVEIQRIGHTALLARLLGVRPEKLIHSRRCASLRPPVQRGTSPAAGGRTPRRASVDAEIHCGTSCLNTCRSRSCSKGFLPSSVGNVKCPSPFAPSVHHHRSSSSMSSFVSLRSPSVDRKGHTVSENPPRTPASGRTLLALPLEEAITASPNPLLSAPIPTLMRGGQKRQLQEIAMMNSTESVVSRSSPFVAATDAKRIPADFRRSRDNNKSVRSSLGGNGNGHVQTRRICRNCNAFFDREREMYMALIHSLRTQVFLYERRVEEGNSWVNERLTPSQEEQQSQIEASFPEALSFACERSNSLNCHMHSLGTDTDRTPSLSVSREIDECIEVTRKSDAKVTKAVGETKQGFAC